MTTDMGDISTTHEQPAVEAIRHSADVAVLVIHGQADLHSAPELREQLHRVIDDGAFHVVADLTDATFVDSMTLGVLLGAVKRLRPHGGKVAVVCVSPHIRRIFEITLLDRVFALHETLDDAQRAARSRG
jgi:anti-sigma B factor antagonist